MAKRASLVLTSQRLEVASLCAKLYALAKASPFRERWHGEAVTERVGFRKNPLSLAALDSSPEGGALGKEGNSRPYRSTARRSQLVSTKLFASAKASPSRERWHGGAVTERVCSRDENPWRDGVSAPDLHFLFFRQKLFFPFVQLRLIFCSLGDIWPVLVCKCRGVPP